MSPQDRPKIIGLVVAIVIVLGFFVKSLMSSLAAKAAQNAPAPPPQNAPPAVAANGGHEASPKFRGVNTPTTVAYSGVNPFRTVFATPKTGSGSGSAPGMRASEFTETGVKPGGIKIPGVGSDNGGTGKPFGVEPPPMAVIKVEGIMIDRRERMAIVSVGGDTQFLTVGSIFGDKFKVIAISPKTVTFQRGKERFTVEVGSTLGGPAFAPSVKVGSGGA